MSAQPGEATPAGVTSTVIEAGVSHRYEPIGNGSRCLEQMKYGQSVIKPGYMVT
jgi:hypothetical protein